jgi:adenine-specific DNA methylase
MTSTNKYKKKLIEVAIPLEAINAASAREKSIRHGHPSTLHLWWARRPLAACRAVLFAQLVDDPSSHQQSGRIRRKRRSWSEHGQKSVRAAAANCRRSTIPSLGEGRYRWRLNVWV